MERIKKKITEEEYMVGLSKSPYELIPSDILMGYGAYEAKVYTQGNEYYLSYLTGNSCD